jgi:hypothetical protein
MRRFPRIQGSSTHGETRDRVECEEVGNETQRAVGEAVACDFLGQGMTARWKWDDTTRGCVVHKFLRCGAKSL